jgi:hypothetical protein
MHPTRKTSPQQVESHFVATRRGAAYNMTITTKNELLYTVENTNITRKKLAR